MSGSRGSIQNVSIVQAKERGGIVSFPNSHRSANISEAGQWQNSGPIARRRRKILSAAVPEIEPLERRVLMAVTGPMQIHRAPAAIIAAESVQARPASLLGTTPFTTTGENFTVTEGINSGSLVVAKFVDYALLPVLTDLTASIAWGDGNSTTGTMFLDPTAGTLGQGFVVTGSHQYNHAGTQAVIISVNDLLGGTTATITSVATVLNQTLAGVSQTGSTIEGSSFTGALGHFTDANAQAVAADFTGVIDWNDGTGTAIASVANVVGGGFNISGTHVYNHAGDKAPIVTLIGKGGSQSVVNSLVHVANSAMTAIGNSLVATEGSSLGGPTVLASFNDANSNAAAIDFSASVNWQDGSTPTNVTIAADPHGGFDVLTTHTYLHAGTKSPTITITGLAGGTAAATATVLVRNAQLTATGSTLSATEGTALPSTTTFATFTDANASASVGDFLATIDFRNGSGPVAASIAVDPNGGFDVRSAYTPPHPGDLAPIVSIAGLGGGLVSAISSMHVASIFGGLTSQSAFYTEGVASASNTLIGTFTDTNPSALATDFVASINWGDGSPTSTGVITPDLNTPGLFNVRASHVYLHPHNQSYTLTVTATDGSHQTTVGTAGVQYAGLVDGVNTINAVEGQSITTTVAHFSDPNPSGIASDYPFTFAWGDGTTSPLTAVRNVNGGWDLVGTHTFTAASAGLTTTLADTPSASIPGTTLPTINRLGSVIISNAALTSTASSFSMTEHTPFSSQQMAHFSDANLAALANQFTATINWGDGTTSAGTNVAIITNPTGGFDVVSGHYYALGGDKVFRVSILGSGNGLTAATGLAHIDNGILSGSTRSITATEGSPIVDTTVLAHLSSTVSDLAASELTSTVNWGDGTITPATIVASSSGGFDVLAGHTYNHAGDKVFSISVIGTGQSSLSQTGAVHIANAAMTSTSATLNAIEGTPLARGTSQAVVAHFADANTLAAASDFVASIDWGDGSTVAGRIVASANGGFDVFGNHTYNHAGSDDIVVTILGQADGVVTPISTVNVANAVMLSTAVPFTVTEGTAFSGKIISHFTDANPNATADDFNATVTWGDGSPADDSAQIVANPNGGFDVLGAHQYARVGNETVGVTVHGAAAGVTSVTNTAHVAYAALTATALPQSLAVVEGTSFSGVVGLFSDPNSNAIAADFSASVNWGDGSTTVGTVTTNVDGGFAIQGTHTYALNGNRNIVSTITGASFSTTNPMAVADAPLTAVGNTLKATLNVPVSDLPVATFSDPNLLDDASHFSATITWETGHTTVGTVTKTSLGQYSVTGVYTYNSVGTKSAAVAILDAGGSTAVATATINVAGANVTGAYVPFVNKEGTPFTGRLIHFKIPSKTVQLSDWTASIAWGDGTSTTGLLTGSVKKGFDVSGSHTWTHGGYKPVSVTITNTPTGRYTIIGGNNFVTPTPIVATGATLSGVAGTALSFAVASFTNANPFAIATDFTPIVKWGDGQYSIGSVLKSGNNYSILASHTYDSAATYAVKTQITDISGATAAATSKAIIAREGGSGPVSTPKTGQVNQAGESPHAQRKPRSNLQRHVDCRAGGPGENR